MIHRLSPHDRVFLKKLAREPPFGNPQVGRLQLRALLEAPRVGGASALPRDDVAGQARRRGHVLHSAESTMSAPQALPRCHALRSSTAPQLSQIITDFMTIAIARTLKLDTRAFAWGKAALVPSRSGHRESARSQIQHRRPKDPGRFRPSLAWRVFRFASYR